VIIRQGNIICFASDGQKMFFRIDYFIDLAQKDFCNETGLNRHYKKLSSKNLFK